MNDLKPDVKKGKGLSAIWIVPIVAVLMGLWMVAYSFMNEGPTFTVSFNTAADLVAGKTKIKYLSVDIGQVESVSLDPDITGVIVTAKLEKEYETLLRDDSRFWVERVRVGAGGVSGLGTILSGAYIKLAPGGGLVGAKEFKGLEAPPLTAVDAPGIRLTLETDNANSVSAGDPVLYQGVTVGQVESMTLDESTSKIHYSVFINAPYHKHVTSTVRFWNASGVSMQASAAGVEFSSGSLETLLSGGVAFAVPEGFAPGGPVEQETLFTIYDNYQDTLEKTYQHGVYYVMEFSQDTSGLLPGAPVSYRGVIAGRVVRLLLKEFVSNEVSGAGDPIPVLVYVQPGMIELEDTAESVKGLELAIQLGIKNGLRGTLKTGNLLTGSQFIAMDYYIDAVPASLSEFDGYPVIPTIESGLGRIENAASKFMDTLNQLPLQQTVTNANEAIVSANDAIVRLDAALASIDRLLKTRETQGLPAQLTETLRSMRKVLDGLSPESQTYKDLQSSLNKLNSTLQNMDELTGSLSETATLLPAPDNQDVIPEARKP